MISIILGETDKRIEEGVEPAQIAPEGELPDEENLNQPDEQNLNQGQDLGQSHTEGRTPEQGEGILDEAQGKICLQFSYHDVMRLMRPLTVDFYMYQRSHKFQR